MSFGFGALPGFANMRPEDVASLFSGPLASASQGFGVLPAVPPGFSGSVSRGIAPFGALPAPQVAMDEADTQRLEAGMMPPAAASLRMPSPPIRPASLPARAAAEAPAPTGGMTNPPLPPARPPEFGSSADPAPAAAPAAPAGEPPSMIDRFLGGIKSGLGSVDSDLLMGLGLGLMSQRGFGPGAAAGLKYGTELQNSRAARDLAGAKQATEMFKLRQSLGNSDQLAQLAMQKNPGMTIDQARAAVGNQSYANELLKGFVPPNEVYAAPEKDASGNLVQRNTRTGQTSILQAAKDDAYTITDAPDGSKIAIKKDDPTNVQIIVPGQPPRALTDPEREAFGLQKGTGAYMTAQGPKGIGGGTAVTVNNAVNPILKGLGDQFVEGAAAARASADTVRSIQNARSQLDAPGGIFSGQWANQQLALQKVGAFFGATNPDAITNTETFRTQIKPIVLETVKGLGAGSGISNADRDFAQQAVGSDITLNESTIRRVLDITERAARAKVTRHNSMADQMLATQPDLKQLSPMLRVELPEAAAPAANPGAGIAAPYDRSALEQEMRRRGMIR